MNERIIDKLTKDIFSNDYFKELFVKCSLISAKTNIYHSSNINGFTSKELIDSLRFADILSNYSK